MKFIVSHFMGGGNARARNQLLSIKSFIILQIRQIAETRRLAMQSQIYSGQRVNLLSYRKG